MGVIARAFSYLAERRLNQFERASRDPLACQQAVLRRLLRLAGPTEWGRRFGFARIRTPEEFRRRVPVTEYEGACGDWHRAFAGERDVTWPGHVRFFALSSGTTAGNKLIPVTPDAVRANFRSGGLLAAFLARRGDAANLAAGKFLYLGGSTALRTEGRSLVGDASGIVARHLPFYARRRSLPAPDLRALTNWEEKIRGIVERYLTANVCVLGACPSWAALLFKQMRQEARARGLGERPVGQLWAKLSHVVSYGMAFAAYRPAFDEYIGRPVHYVDTHSSSEAGMTAIQAEPGGPLRMIVNNGVFYEFIPAERAHEDQPPRLDIGQVEAGREYALAVSTNGGIWAYPLGDVVRFETLRPPRIVFAGRTQIQLSAFGEHVTLEMIEQALAAACRATSALVADYTISPRFPTPDRPRPAHHWIVEFDRAPSDASAFTATLDARIRRDNEDYEAHRTGDYGLAPPVLVPVASGTFYAWMKRKGKLGGQHKVPRVVRSPEMADELLAISAGLSGP